MDPSPEVIMEGLGMGIGAIVTGTVVSCSCFVGGFVATQACFRGVRAGRGMVRMLRVRSLGGVTILEHPMGRDCAMCQYPMDAGEEIRTLSCGHVFHTSCDSSVDNWLRDHDLRCPFCRRIARCVRVIPWPWPWNAQAPEEPEPEPEPEPEVVVEVEAEAEAEVVVEVEPEPEPEVVAEAEPEVVVEVEAQVELAPEANLPQSQEGSSSSTHVVIDMEAPATSSAQRPEEQHPPPASSLEEPLLNPSASP